MTTRTERRATNRGAEAIKELREALGDEHHDNNSDNESKEAGQRNTRQGQARLLVVPI